jgi:hypothetical protein
VELEERRLAQARLDEQLRAKEALAAEAEEKFSSVQV